MPPTYHPKIVHRFGHGRWNEEERGFNDLATNCHFDHPYHHHPIALLAMLWIIAIAFNLSYAFYQRNLKPEIRKEKIRSRSQLAVTIIETFNSLTLLTLKLDEPIFSILPLSAQPQPP